MAPAVAAGFPDGRLNPAAYGPYGIIAASLMAVSILLSAIGTHRFIPFLPKPAAQAPKSIWQMFGEMFGTLKNKMFATVAATALFAAAAEGIGFSIYIYFVTYFWKLTATQMGILITDAFFGSLIAFFIAPTAMWLLVVTVALTLAPLSLRLLGLFPGDGSPALIPTLYAIATVRGALGITCAILITAMIADVVEDSQVATGRRSEGVFFAAISFIQKSVSGVGAMLTGVILTVIHFPVGKPASMVPQGT
eukprot:gene27710-27993_t